MLTQFYIHVCLKESVVSNLTIILPNRNAHFVSTEKRTIFPTEHYKNFHHILSILCLETCRHLKLIQTMLELQENYMLLVQPFEVLSQHSVKMAFSLLQACSSTCHSLISLLVLCSVLSQTPSRHWVS